jgi:methylisocitrate lyase
MVLYPLSVFRAMNAAADEVYRTIRADGTQRTLTDRMQTRAELYEVLNYHALEEQLDRTPKS